jgi:hypothetical protein
MAKAGFVDGVVPQVIGVPRFATGGAMNIHDESPFWCVVLILNPP